VQFAAKLPGGGPLKIAEQGREHFYGIYRVGDYPVMIAFARSKDQVLGYWREMSIAAGAAFLALAAGTGVLGVYLIRQIRLHDTLEPRIRSSQIDGG